MTLADILLLVLAAAVALAACFVLGWLEGGVGAVVALVLSIAIVTFWPIAWPIALLGAEALVYLGIWFLDADL